MSLKKQNAEDAHKISSSSSCGGGGGAPAGTAVEPGAAATTGVPCPASHISSSSSSTSSSSSPLPSASPANLFTPAPACVLMSSQPFLRLAMLAADFLLLRTLLEVLSTISSALSRPRSWRLRALVLRTALRPRLDFLVTPALWCRPRTEGRASTDSGGGRTSLSDLSVLMLGDVARRAAREWMEGAASVCQI